MKFGLLFVRSLLIATLAVVTQAVLMQPAHAQSIEVNILNRHTFLIIKGSLGLACHRPAGSTETLYGEIDTVLGASGVSQQVFTSRGRNWVRQLQRKYNDQIRTLRRRLERERDRDASRALINQIKAKLKQRLSALKQARSALNGCQNFTPGAPAIPQVPPPVEEEDLEEELTFDDSPFPQLPRNLDGTVKLDPSELSIVFYVSYRGNDADNGLSPEGAVRTFARAWQLLTQASSHGVTAHQIRFERGGVYNDQLAFMSGWSSRVPFVIGDYGPTNLPRPIMTQPVQISGTLKNIALTGLDFYNPARDPFAPTFNPGSPDLVAIRINGGVSRILVQLSNIRAYTNGIFITGAGGSGAQLARRVASIRNNFLDLYNLHGGMNGFTLGVYAHNVNGLNVTGNLFARVGNPLGLSSEQGNTGQSGLPVVNPDPKAWAVAVDQKALGYVVVRDSQFIDGVVGVKINGFIFDQFNQLDGQLGTVEIYSNLFYRMSHAVNSWTPAVTIYDNAVVEMIRRPLVPYVSGFQLKDSSALDVYRNVFINSLTDYTGKDRGIYVWGHAEFAYHKVFQNKFYNVVGEIIYGKLEWYDTLWVDGPFGPRQVPFSQGPESITIRDNIIMSSNTRQALVEVAQSDRGINNMTFRNNTLWNPNAPEGRLWASEEHGNITGLDNVYEDIPPECNDPFHQLFCELNPLHSNCQACLNPICLYKEVTRTPNIRMTQANWYPSVGAGLIVPGGTSYSVLGSWGPNRIAIPCDSAVTVGLDHYLNTLLTLPEWLQFINRNGQNELPPGTANGLRIAPTSFSDPERTIATFLATNNIQVRDENGLRPATTLNDYVDYVANFWRHTPNEEVSLDPRTWGKNVQIYFAGGLNILAP
jgi:hypothetical protein